MGVLEKAPNKCMNGTVMKRGRGGETGQEGTGHWRAVLFPMGFILVQTGFIEL